MPINVRYFGTTKPRPGVTPIWQETVHKLPFGHKNPIDWTDGRHLVQLAKKEDKEEVDGLGLPPGKHGDILVYYESEEFEEWQNVKTDQWSTGKMAMTPEAIPFLVGHIDDVREDGSIIHKWKVTDLWFEYLRPIWDAIKKLQDELNDLANRLNALEKLVENLASYIADNLPPGELPGDVLQWVPYKGSYAWRPKRTEVMQVLKDVEYDQTTRNFTKYYRNITAIEPQETSDAVVFKAVVECP